MSALFTSSFFTLWKNEALNDHLYEVLVGTMRFNSNFWLIQRMHHSWRRPHLLFSNRNRDRDYRLFNQPRSHHVTNPPRLPGRRFLPSHWRKPEHLNLAKSLWSLQKPPKYPSARQVESSPLTVQQIGFGHQQCEISACSSISPQSLTRCLEFLPFLARRLGFRPSPGRLVRNRVIRASWHQPWLPGRWFLSSRRRKPEGSSSAPISSLQDFTETSFPQPLSEFDNKQGAKSLKVPSTNDSLTHNEKGAEPLKGASLKDYPIYCHRPPGISPLAHYFASFKASENCESDEDDCDEKWQCPSEPVPSPNQMGQPEASSSDESDEIIRRPSLPVPSPNQKAQPEASSSLARLDESDEIIKRPSLPVPSPNLKDQPGTSSSSAWCDELNVDQDVPSPSVSSPQPHSSSQVPPNDPEHFEFPEPESSLSLQEYNVSNTNTMFCFPHNPNVPVVRPFPSPMGWLWSVRSPQYSPPQLEPELELQRDLEAQHPLVPVVPDLVSVLQKEMTSTSTPFVLVTRPSFLNVLNETAWQPPPEPDQLVPEGGAPTKRNADAYEDADSLIETPPGEFVHDTQFIVPPLTPPLTPSPSPPHY